MKFIRVLFVLVLLGSGGCKQGIRSIIDGTQTNVATSTSQASSTSPTSPPLAPGSTPLNLPFSSGASQAKECASDFGEIQKFNVFVFENLVQEKTDVEGRLAVGGNAEFTDYSIGALINKDKNRDDLIIGGNLSFTRGSVFSGSILYTGSAAIANLSVLGTSRQGLPGFSFSKLRQAAERVSDELSGLPSSGQTSIQGGDGATVGIFLKGADPLLNVFRVSSADLSKAHSLNISAPESSTVIVNVSGENSKVTNFGFFFEGIRRNRVVFNFYEAKVLDISRIHFEGTLLAPFAALNFNNGLLEGHLIVKSLTGGGQTNHDPLAVCLPIEIAPTATPHPTSGPTAFPTAAPSVTPVSSPAPTVLPSPVPSLNPSAAPSATPVHAACENSTSVGNCYLGTWVVTRSELVYDSLKDQTRVTYSVSGTKTVACPGKDLSHWVLAFANSTSTLPVVSVQRNGSPYNNTSFGADSTTGSYGLKFDAGQAIGTASSYSVTLSGNWTSTPTDIFIKAGSGDESVVSGKVCGLK